VPRCPRQQPDHLTDPGEQVVSPLPHLSDQSGELAIVQPEQSSGVIIEQ
jgi:hypothetical protein